MHRHRLVTLLIAALLTIGSLTHRSLGWGHQGHMMIAYIAYQQFSDEQRTTMIEILKGNPELFAMISKGLDNQSPANRDMYTFMRAATWPDMIRDDHAPMHDEARSNWHFVNFPIATDNKPHADPPTAWSTGQPVRNILQALALCEHDLKNAQTSAKQRAIRLCWMLHLLGDLHQPLHTVALFADRYPKGDQGGNMVWVLLNGKPIRLHSLWDGLPGSSKSAKVAANAGKELLEDDDLTRTALAANLSKAAYTDWCDESRDLARKHVYKNGKFPSKTADATEAKPSKLPRGYHAKALQIADQRITLAGYRLGDKLKEVLAAP